MRGEFGLGGRVRSGLFGSLGWSARNEGDELARLHNADANLVARRSPHARECTRYGNTTRRRTIHSVREPGGFNAQRRKATE